jgi:hypothetical protein
MHPFLTKLIKAFRQAQDMGVATLTGRLGIPRPANHVDWLRICRETGLYDTREIDGVGVFAHGHGIALVIDGLSIDFDWGEQGEPDGFDVWRLYNFLNTNRPGSGVTYESVKLAVEEAHQAGELIQPGHRNSLYYDPTQRAGEMPSTEQGGVA